MNTLSLPLIATPASDDAMLRELLVYLDAHDAASNTDYAFVAYKETHRASGAWCVRINARNAGGAYFHPNAIRLQARAATAQRKSSFIWSSPLTPRLGDPRKIEYSVHVSEGQPEAIEIFVRLRNYDGTADEPVVATFPWPTE